MPSTVLAEGVPVTLTTLFCDLVASTEMLTRLGDRRALSVQREVLTRLRAAVEAAHGQHVKTLGDGVMAIFSSCAAAVECAMSMQRSLATSPTTEVRSLSLRVGLSVGEVIPVDGDFFGSSLVEAARLCAMALGGQILATSAVEVVMGAAGDGLFRRLGHLPVRGLPAGLDIVVAGADTSPAESVTSLLAKAADAWPDGAVPPGPASGLIGRQAEIEAVRSCLRRAQEGQEQLLLVSGEAGIGKSRLLDEAAAQALTRGFRVAAGSCHDGLGAPAYWPWLQALRAVTDRLSDSQLTAALGTGATVLATAVPELRRRLGMVPTTPTLAAEQARFQMLEAIATFFMRVTAVSPVLVTLDDLHWADVASVEMVLFALRMGRGSRLAVLATVRDDAFEAHHPLARLLGDLGRNPSVNRLELVGLPPPDAAALLAYTLGEQVAEPVVAAVHRYAAGNPLFMAEIGRLLRSEGRLDKVRPDGPLLLNRVPVGIRGVIGRRLDQLSSDCLALLTVVAVDGTEISVETIAQTLQVNLEDLAAPVDEAREASILVDAGPGLIRYGHALVRDTVLESLHSGERARWERRLALVLEPTSDPADPAAVSRLAEHFVNAAHVLGDPERAIHYASAAARAAAAAGAHAAAADHLRHALDLLPTAQRHSLGQVELLLALGDAIRRTGELSEARRIFEGLLQEPIVGADPSLLAQAALGLGCGLGGYGFADRADPLLLAALERALAALADRPGALRIRVLSRLALELHFTGDARRRAQLAAQAVQEAQQLAEPATLLVAMYSASWTSLAPDRLAARTAAAAEIICLAEQTGDAEMSFRGRLLQLVGRLEQGDTAGAQADLKILARLAEALDQPLYHWQVGVLRAMDLLRAGELELAQQQADAAVQIGQGAVGDISMVMYGAQMLYLHWIQGRLDAVEPSVARFADNYPHAPAWRAALAFLYAESGDMPAARAQFEQLSDLAALPFDGNWLTAVAMIGWTCVALGDAPAAERLTAILLPYQDRDVVMAAGAVTFGSVAHLLGSLALVQGDRPAAERWIGAALDRHQQQAAPTMLSWTSRTAEAVARLTTGTPAAPSVDAHRASGRVCAGGVPPGSP